MAQYPETYLLPCVSAGDWWNVHLSPWSSCSPSRGHVLHWIKDFFRDSLPNPCSWLPWQSPASPRILPTSPIRSAQSRLSSLRIVPMWSPKFIQNSFFCFINAGYSLRGISSDHMALLPARIFTATSGHLFPRREKSYHGIFLLLQLPRVEKLLAIAWLPRAPFHLVSWMQVI